MRRQGADGGHQRHRVRPESGAARLQVEELLAPEVEPEARLGQHHLGVLERQLGGDHARATVRDVRERTGVHEGGRTVARLRQVRVQRVLQ